MPNNNKIAVVTLGCPRNVVDSEEMAGRLAKKGARIVGNAEEAETVIINTCAFIREAKEESIAYVLDALELKSQGRIKRVVVAGCLSQRYPREIARELPGIDAISGKIALSFSPQRVSAVCGHYAYLKICEGCLHSCSFCVIPKIKGPLRSKPPRDILREVSMLDKRNIRELDIIGQDISAYGRDRPGPGGLASLLPRIVERADNIAWIRLLYLNPAHLSPELIEVIASQPKICKYVDLPLQHINGRILRLMNRETGPAGILRLIDRIRSRIPKVALRTSLIVGFPSETEREFKELLRFVRDVRFERLGAFMYSREEGTAAYRFPGQVSQRVKAERLDRLMRCQQGIAAEINRSLLGQDLDVIIDEKDADGAYRGRTQADAPEVDGRVTVNSGRELMPGDIARVKIEKTYEYDLVGKQVSA
ncbi:MAG: MiaB/RimO family radical SAM methylthiotransferase [Candidatus Omnitrophota bacterium]